MKLPVIVRWKNITEEVTSFGIYLVTLKNMSLIIISSVKICYVVVLGNLY